MRSVKKIAQPCHVATILRELQRRLPSSEKPKIEGARRTLAAHASRCTICQRVKKKAAVLTSQEFVELGDAIGDLFEAEAMHQARLECADRHGDLAADESEAA